MIALVWAFVRLWWRQRRCRHAFRLVEKPDVALFIAYLERRITLEEYRAGDVPVRLSTCCDCGRRIFE